MQVNNQRRKNFHYQIRRHHLNNLFESKRKEFLLSQENERQAQQMDVIYEQNRHIFDMSLVKNGLLNQVNNQNLLLQLKEKAHKHLDSDTNRKDKNFKFILAICSNILLDDLSLDNKEFIAIQICMQICYYFTQKQKVSCTLDKLQSQSSQNYSSSLSEVSCLLYYFRNLLLISWQLDQLVQEQIQNLIIPYVVRLLPIARNLQKAAQKSYEVIAEDIQHIVNSLFKKQDKFELLSFAEQNQELIHSIVSYSEIFQPKGLTRIWMNLSMLPTNKTQLHRNRWLTESLLQELISQAPSCASDYKPIYVTLKNFLTQTHSALFQDERDAQIILDHFTKAEVCEQFFALLEQLVCLRLFKISPYCQSLTLKLLQTLDNSSIMRPEDTISCLNVIEKIYSLDDFHIGWNYFKNAGGIKVLQNLYQESENKDIVVHIERLWDLCIDMKE